VDKVEDIGHEFDKIFQTASDGSVDLVATLASYTVMFFGLIGFCVWLSGDRKEEGKAKQS